MTFILVTLSIMGASIFLIYKLTNHFGFRMKYKSLFLCAFMAFMVNVAAISMSPYLTKAHYIRLVLLVIVAAAVVTLYNEYLVRHDTVAADGTEALPAKEAPSDNPGFMGKLASKMTLAPLQAALTGKLALLAGLRKREKELPQESTEESLPVSTSETENNDADVKKSDTKNADTQKAELKEADPKETAPADMPSEKAVPPAEEPKKRATPPAEPAPEPPVKGAKAKREKAVKMAEKQAKKAEAAKNTAPAPLRVELTKFQSLDDLLDYAYEQQSEKHMDEAILAYKGALETYGDDAYAPFIVIDLGNIYKERAAYKDAIRTYEDALSLPVIANDAATSEKFRENLSYLRTVQYILSKHNSPQMPFQEIPADYLKEIEAEFQSRQMQS